LDRTTAIALLDELHRAQNEFYGGDSEPLRTLLTPDIAWIVPGQNHIAGSPGGHRSRTTADLRESGLPEHR
jgi:hypothetical protein